MKYYIYEQPDVPCINIVLRDMELLYYIKKRLLIDESISKIKNKQNKMTLFFRDPQGNVTK